MSSIAVVWQAASSLVSQPLTTPASEPGGTFSGQTGVIALTAHNSLLLPEDDCDQQPLWNSERSACMVAAVRLDNRPDLVRDLQLAASEQLADSAVLFAAWLRWGSSCLDHIVGSFAFAVWQPRLRELFAARDHVGDASLVYFRDANQFALASMPHMLLAIPGVPRRVNYLRCVESLLLTAPDRASTFFDGIHTLPPGHLLRVTPDSIRVTCYWQPSDAKPVRFRRDEEYAEALADLLDQATEPRLRARGPISCQLSGGLDSTSVLASAARLLAARGQTLTAYTSVPQPAHQFPGSFGRILDEGDRAASVAALYPNVHHRRVDLAGCNLPDTIRRMTAAMDEPPGNPVSHVWFRRIMELARTEGSRVMLVGVRGNVTISYDDVHFLSQQLRSGHWLRLARHAYQLRRAGGTSYRRALSHALLGLPTAVRRIIHPTSLNQGALPDTANPATIAALDVAARALRNQTVVPPDYQAQRKFTFERFDYGAAVAGTLALTDVEQRDPTADKRIFDFCYGVPQEQSSVGGHTRSLLRRAMRGRLPDEIRLSYKFGIQSADWYLPVQAALGEFAQELDHIQLSATANDILNLPRLRQLVDTFPASGLDSDEIEAEYGHDLSRGMSMAYFIDQVERRPG